MPLLIVYSINVLCFGILLYPHAVALNTATTTYEKSIC